jgi:hypothetical protein
MVAFRSFTREAPNEVGIRGDVELAESLLHATVVIDPNVGPVGDLQDRRVERLRRQRDGAGQPRAAQHVGDRHHPVRRILRPVGLHDDALFVTLARFDDAFGDLDVARQNPEVRVGDENLRAGLGESDDPLELGLNTLQGELADLGIHRPSPVAEGAAIGAAAVGLVDEYPGGGELGVGEDRRQDG